MTFLSWQTPKLLSKTHVRPAASGAVRCSKKNSNCLQQCIPQSLRRVWKRLRLLFSAIKKHITSKILFIYAPQEIRLQLGQTKPTFCFSRMKNISFVVLNDVAIGVAWNVAEDTIELVWHQIGQFFRIPVFVLDDVVANVLVKVLK